MIANQETAAIVNDAIQWAAALSGAYRHDILRALEKTKNLLRTSAPTSGQRGLVLRAAQRNIVEAEHRLRACLVEAHPANLSEQIGLVEARTLCWQAFHQLHRERDRAHSPHLLDTNDSRYFPSVECARLR